MFRVRIELNVDGVCSSEVYTFANSDADSVTKAMREASQGVFYITDIHGKSLFVNFARIKTLQLSVLNLSLLN
jgi:hypothetical protein